MKLPTPRQIAKAWWGMDIEYVSRRNKARTDGKQWEVAAIHPGPISEDTVKVIASFKEREDAEYSRERFEDNARANAVLALFRT